MATKKSPVKKKVATKVVKKAPVKKVVKKVATKKAATKKTAKKLVKKEGRLIYSTCSLLKRENESIVEAFLKHNENFKSISVDDILIKNQIPLSTGNFLKLTPHNNKTDGFFAAVLERID